MDLKLKNNSSLAITSALPQPIGSACTSLFINGCPNVSGIAVLRSCPNLDRVFVNIGSVSGPMSELVSYANIDGGFDTTGNFVEKPYIIGAFTVTGFYTQGQIDACTNAFYNNALTIVSDPNKNIDTLLANTGVQVLDEDEVNFNPAVAIKLQAGGLGTLLDFRYTEHGGKWFALKSDLANINQATANSKLAFSGTSSLADSNGIITDNTTTNYDFESFDEFEYFTGISTIKGGTGSNSMFYNCSNLKYLTIPPNITNIESQAFMSTGLLRITYKNTNPISFGTSVWSSSACNVTSVYVADIDVHLKNNYSNNDSQVPVAYHLYNLNGTEITSISIPYGETVINARALRNAAYLTQVSFPSTLTTINTSAFDNCSSLSSIIFNSAVDIKSSAFANCTGLTNLFIPRNSILNTNSFKGCTGLTYVECYGWTVHDNIQDMQSPFIGAGNGTGTFISHGNIEYGTSDKRDRNIVGFKTAIIDGDIIQNSAYPSASGVEVFRISGNYSNSSSGPVTNVSSSSTLKFFELGGTLTGGGRVGNGWSSYYNGCILHLAYTDQNLTNIAMPYTKVNNNNGRISKVYVGDGSSRTSDQAVKALYLADTDGWATISAKLDIWYDYNGEYKWYYITDNLTNCTNTNPDAWPHITRGEEYRTTIVANEGYTLGTVKVEMYSAKDNSLTPDEPTDITSTVYNASTGEIYIQEVVGNVIITANAS